MISYADLTGLRRPAAFINQPTAPAQPAVPAPVVGPAPAGYVGRHRAADHREARHSRHTIAAPVPAGWWPPPVARPGDADTAVIPAVDAPTDRIDPTAVHATRQTTEVNH